MSSSLPSSSCFTPTPTGAALACGASCPASSSSHSIPSWPGSCLTPLAVALVGRALSTCMGCSACCLACTQTHRTPIPTTALNRLSDREHFEASAYLLHVELQVCGQLLLLHPLPLRECLQEDHRQACGILTVYSRARLGVPRWVGGRIEPTAREAHQLLEAVHPVAVQRPCNLALPHPVIPSLCLLCGRTQKHAAPVTPCRPMSRTLPRPARIHVAAALVSRDGTPTTLRGRPGRAGPHEGPPAVPAGPWRLPAPSTLRRPRERHLRIAARMMMMMLRLIFIRSPPASSLKTRIVRRTISAAGAAYRARGTLTPHGHPLSAPYPGTGEPRPNENTNPNPNKTLPLIQAQGRTVGAAAGSARSGAGLRPSGSGSGSGSATRAPAFAERGPGAAERGRSRGEGPRRSAPSERRPSAPACSGGASERAREPGPAPLLAAPARVGGPRPIRPSRDGATAEPVLDGRRLGLRASRLLPAGLRGPVRAATAHRGPPAIDLPTRSLQRPPPIALSSRGLNRLGLCLPCVRYFLGERARGSCLCKVRSDGGGSDRLGWEGGSTGLVAVEVGRAQQRPPGRASTRKVLRAVGSPEDCAVVP
eukprot:scaffold336_cov384-Prasinococcus_capsulatus_cf.AAC.21